MSGPPPDGADLRARFQALAREVEAQAPAYVPAQRARPAREARPAGARPAAVRSRWPLVALGGTGLVAALAAVLILARRPAPRSQDALAALRLDLSTVTWVAPTDFLLETPGARYLRTVPTFGAGLQPPLPLRPGPASRPAAPGRNPS